MTRAGTTMIETATIGAATRRMITEDMITAVDANEADGTFN
jgi:hypothetical protein